MRDDPIRVGCVVRLKSGGPPMTANRPEGDAWECLWFDGDELRSAVIAADALESYAGRSGPRPVITLPRGDGDAVDAPPIPS